MKMPTSGVGAPSLHQAPPNTQRGDELAAALYVNRKVTFQN